MDRRASLFSTRSTVESCIVRGEQCIKSPRSLSWGLRVNNDDAERLPFVTLRPKRLTAVLGQHRLRFRHAQLQPNRWLFRGSRLSTHRILYYVSERSVPLVLTSITVAALSLSVRQNGPVSRRADTSSPSFCLANSPTFRGICVSTIGRVDVEWSQVHAAMNAWLPQASYPCGHSWQLWLNLSQA